MSLHYYANLTSELERARDYKEQTFQALTPFYQYLHTAIQSLRKIGEQKVLWNPLGIQKIQLKPKFYLYRKANKTKVRILQNSSEWFYVKNLSDKIDFSEEIICKELRKKFRITPKDISEDKKQIRIPELNTLFPKDKEILTMTWGFDDFEVYKNKETFVKISSVVYEKEEISFKVIDDKILELDTEIEENKKLFVNSISVDYEILSKSSSYPNLKIFKDLSDYKILLSQTKLKEEELEELKVSEIVKELGIHEDTLKEFYLQDKPKEKFPESHVADSSQLEFVVNEPEKYDKKIFIYKYKSFQLSFEAWLKEPNPKEKYLIQLEESESEKGDDPYTTSPIDYFFEPDVEVKDDRGNKYSIDYRNREDAIISLKQEGRSVLPSKDSKYLRVSANTYQLAKQKDAINILQYKPTKSQIPLVKLFLDRKNPHINWGFVSTDIFISEWFVLNRTETEAQAIQEEQRSFIYKALSTPDFAILEGPPGSGKTTVILELICQLLVKGARVLLCGSTHVAIDNVLERLKEKGLIEGLQVLPLRIGSEDNISSEVEEFQIDKQVEKYKSLGVGESLVYKAANLVCGTTIGILQYPPFKKTRSEEYPILPEFDYLIIDECSKTTFHEFLVPAVYAKKWILVGDVQQLSPFVDRAQFVNNLRFMDLGKGKELPESVQNACFKLYLAYQFCNHGKNKIAFVIQSKDELDSLVIEIIARIKLEQKDSRNKAYFKIVTRESPENKENEEENLKVLFYNPENSIQEIFFADVIFIHKDFISNALDRIPEFFFIFGYPEWVTTSHYYRHRKLYENGAYTISLKHKGKEISSFEKFYELLESDLMDKDWAEEVAWRLIREFELRSKLEKEQKRKRFSQELEEFLIPRSIEGIAPRLVTLGNVAFPSILEGLQKGIKGRFKDQRETTIASGFKENELSLRHAKLSYQHRMHPSISEFPRKQFYNNEALKTSVTVEKNRNWNYLEYSERAVWIHIKGKTFGNENEKEAGRILQELQKFLQWCKNQKHSDPLGKDGLWKIAVLTFYRGQERLLRNKLQDFTKQQKRKHQFQVENAKILLYTVDKFQGQEADIVFLSMVQTTRDGFLDSPNRLNVAITRARYQLVIVGDHDYFLNRSYSEDLKNLAKFYEDKRME